MFRGAATHGDTKQSYGPALIDDHTPPPAHAKGSWRRALAILAIAVTLWGTVLSAIAWSDTLFRMGWFFTNAALVTFRGAYAVLPYVFQGAVEQYGWVTTSQMIGGLALGETTPGPLIVVVAFVGYLGAYADAAQIGLSPVAAGALGAVCVTSFTFLPSFFFIFIGAPFVESTRGNLHLTSALNGNTAAAVGVLLYLAVFLALPRALANRLRGRLRVAVGTDRRGFRRCIVPIQGGDHSGSARIRRCRTLARIHRVALNEPIRVTASTPSEIAAADRAVDTVHRERAAASESHRGRCHPRASLQDRVQTPDRRYTRSV
jgi:chromate transport protein ChrA